MYRRQRPCSPRVSPRVLDLFCPTLPRTIAHDTRACVFVWIFFFRGALLGAARISLIQKRRGLLLLLLRLPLLCSSLPPPPPRSHVPVAVVPGVLAVQTHLPFVAVPLYILPTSTPSSLFAAVQVYEDTINSY